MWTDNDTTMQNQGGYMDVSANGTITDNKASHLRRAQNCIPMMLAHLNRYGEDLQVWGMPARQVTFVAIVTKIEAASTKVTIEFRDETGVIKGIKWMDADAMSDELPVSVNSYARVYGSMRSQNNENYVLIANIQPMEHLNELLTHLMEVTLVSLEGEKMMDKVAQDDLSFINKAVNVPASNGNAVSNNPHGLNREQDIVFSIIKEKTTEYGAERDEIKAQVPPHVAVKVDEILEFLSSEGHIYTTKTDDHFKII